MKQFVMLVLIILQAMVSFSQTLNHEVIDENGKSKLLGKIDKVGLQKPAYAEWFNTNYEAYEANDKIVSKLKDSLKDYTIKVFLGTWCGDSRRGVPNFYNIIETVNFPKNQLEVIGLDTTSEAYKQSPNGEEKGMNVHRVPTYIFYKNGKEVNRIVERPVETLERDMLKIVSNQRYSPYYKAADYIQYLFNEKPLDSLQQVKTKLATKLSEYVKGSRELNTLGYVYLRANAIDKALFVFQINTLIFPYKDNVYDSLAEAYYETENDTEALKNYYKVLSRVPDNKNALEMVETIKARMKLKLKER